MHGYLHIFRSGNSAHPLNDTYQLSFNVGESTYSRKITKTQLVEILEEEIALPKPTISRTLDDLELHGKATIPNLNLPESEAAALGLVQQASDL